MHPQKETYWGNVNPIGPRACYDEGKRCAEALAAAYMQQYNTQVRIARIFNTYGPRMRPDDGRVVSNFIIQAMKGEPITVYGKGGQTRSFCYYRDTVIALEKLMEVPDNVGPVNIGNPEEQTILDIAKAVKAITRSTSEIVFKPLPEDDPVRRCPDITKAKWLLGWNPQISFEEGLLQTYVYFKTRMGNYG